MQALRGALWKEHHDQVCVCVAQRNSSAQRKEETGTWRRPLVHCTLPHPAGRQCYRLINLGSGTDCMVGDKAGRCEEMSHDMRGLSLKTIEIQLPIRQRPTFTNSLGVKQMGVLANNTDSDTFGCKQTRYDGSPKSACEFGPIQVSRFHVHRVKLAKPPNPRPGEASLRNSMRTPWQRQWIMAVFPRGRGIVPLVSQSQKAAHLAVFWTGRVLSIDILGSLRSRMGTSTT